VTGKSTIRKPRKRIIPLINKEITRNDQKFLDDAAKNSAEENVFSDFLRLLNKPPLRKVLNRNPVNKTRNNPEENDGIRLVALLNRSVTTDISIPSVNLSVIMLFPKPDFTAPLSGNVTREIIKREVNQTIRIPFHVCSALTNPDQSVLNIFITFSFTMLWHK
jgi:hypothetical protein